MIAIKPHHFVDIIVSFGECKRSFEPHPYGHAVHTVSMRILEDRDIELVIENGADDICAPCKHNIGGICDDRIDTSYRPDAPPTKLAWNRLIDSRWCERLGIKQGERITARDLCERIRESIEGMSAVYRELPTDRIARKAANLAKGIDFYLEPA